MPRFRNSRIANATVLIAIFTAALIVIVGTPNARGADNPAPTVAPTSLTPLFTAIATVESGNGKNALDGDNGEAIGPYQIHERYWRDSGTEGHYSDCRGAAYSQRVMVNYWTRYCPDALKERHYEVLARTHNGGPNGRIRDCTIGYWRKVESALSASDTGSIFDF